MYERQSTGQHSCAAHAAELGHWRRTRGWSTLLPLLACAACPACLATYTKALSLLGIGVRLDERAHTTVLIVAISVSLAISAWRSFRSQRRWPIFVALAGAAFVVAGHNFGDAHAVEWAGVAIPLVGAINGQWRVRGDALPSDS